MLNRDQKLYVKKNWKKQKDEEMAGEIGSKPADIFRYRKSEGYLADYEKVAVSRRRFVVGAAGVLVATAIGLYGITGQTRDVNFGDSVKNERLRQRYLDRFMEEPLKTETNLQHAEALIYDPEFETLQKYWEDKMGNGDDAEKIKKYLEDLETKRKKNRVAKQIIKASEENRDYYFCGAKTVQNSPGKKGTLSRVYIPSAFFESEVILCEADARAVLIHEGMHTELYHNGSISFDISENELGGMKAEDLVMSESCTETIDETICYSGQIIFVKKKGLQISAVCEQVMKDTFDINYSRLEGIAKGDDSDAIFARNILKRLKIKKDH